MSVDSKDPRAEPPTGEPAERTEPRPEQSAARMLALGAEIVGRLDDEWKTREHGDLLHDGRGLPR